MFTSFVRGYTSADRERALEEEELIDLHEWAEVRALPPPLGVPSAATRALWDAIEAVPFGMLGRVTPDERVLHVTRQAQRALERWLKENPDAGDEDRFSLDFAASLPHSRSSRAHTILRLVGGLDERGQLAITIGLPADFHPVSGRWSGFPRTSASRIFLTPEAGN